MTLISNQDSLEEGFIRSALEIIATLGERSAVVARSDHQTVRQLLDRVPKAILLTHRRKATRERAYAAQSGTLPATDALASQLRRTLDACH